jgi:hypothetical protein
LFPVTQALGHDGTSLISDVVFLRALDYFQGILFLTTNRVGHFDEAFMSRIHLSLGYEPLSDNARNKIWDNLFKKLQQDHKRGGPEITYEYDAKRYVQSRDVQALEWNGREIRNGKLTSSRKLVLFTNKRLHQPSKPLWRWLCLMPSTKQAAKFRK